MSERFAKAREGEDESMVRCQSCERKASEEVLSRCKGCSEVWYCGKVCFQSCRGVFLEPDELTLNTGMPNEWME